jgi:uncharacterized RDD family membrane protein YckC
MADKAVGEYGGFWIRFLAYLTDCAILFVVILALSVVFALTGLTGIGTAVIILLQLLYWPLMQASARQATFGKSMLGLKVAGSEDNRISFLRSLGRELAKIISAFVFMLGFVMAAFTGKKQALHDLIASTTVQRSGPAHVGRAIAVTVVGLVGPVIAIPILGVGLFAGMLGMGTQDMESQMRQEMQKSMQAEAPARKTAPPTAAAPQAQPAVQAKPAVELLAPKPVAELAIAPKPAVGPAPQPRPAPAAKPAPASAPQAPAAAPRAEPRPAPARLDSLPEAPPLPSARSKPSAPSASALRHNDLMSAVLARDTGAVEQLLKMGKWPDKADSNGMTPLMAAVQIGDARSAGLLLRAGANPNASAGGQSVLSLARQRNEFAILDLLQRHGAR